MTMFVTGVFVGVLLTLTLLAIPVLLAIRVLKSFVAAVQNARRQ